MGEIYRQWQNEEKFQATLTGYKASNLSSEAQAALERLVTDDIQEPGVPSQLRTLLARELNTDIPTIAALQSDVQAIHDSGHFSSFAAFPPDEGFGNRVSTRSGRRSSSRR